MSEQVIAYGSIGPAHCSCAMEERAQWFIKTDRLTCSYCGKERVMTVPPRGIMAMPCSCAPGEMATWFITAKGNYICSYCGKDR